MSQENVELVRRHYEAHARGDFTAVFAAYDPEIEWHVLRVAEFGFDPVYVGHDGVRTFWRLWLSAWETTTCEYDEFIDAGERVVVQNQRMRARTSGIELEWTPTPSSGRSRTARSCEWSSPHSRRRSRGTAGVGRAAVFGYSDSRTRSKRGSTLGRAPACYGADVSRSS